MKKLEISSPYNEEVIDTVQLASSENVENALKIATKAFEDRSSWLPAHERIAILERLAVRMESEKEQLTKLALSEGGKPYKDSLVEVERAIQGVKLGIHAFQENAGKEIPMGLTPASDGRIAFTQREPIGVIASLSAFNHPLNLIIHQTIPAIVAGAPVIVKPALTTPLSCINFVNLLHESGLPKEWCQVMVCENEQAERIATYEKTAYLSFIGSAKVGWYLRSKLSPGTRCALEHGGAAPVIVDESADIEEMIPSLMKGAFYHSGQVCVSVQRVFVHKSKFDDVVNALSKEISKLKLGDPANKDTDLGPLILPREVDRVASWVEEAKEQGAKIVSGGNASSKTLYEPTLIVNPPVGAKVSSQEIFGPVVCLYSYDDVSEALNQANSLPYAFQASIFTKDLDKAMDYSAKLNAAAVMINDHTAFRVDWMPFTGRDQSGIGIGGIGYSVHEMSRDKLRVIKVTK